MEKKETGKNSSASKEDERAKQLGYALLNSQKAELEKLGKLKEQVFQNVLNANIEDFVKSNYGTMPMNEMLPLIEIKKAQSLEGIWIELIKLNKSMEAGNVQSA